MWFETHQPVLNEFKLRTWMVGGKFSPPFLGWMANVVSALDTSMSVTHSAGHKDRRRMNPGRTYPHC